MIEKIPRVAFFADSYLEVNGASLTSRQLVGFAEAKGYPFLCVHAGEKTLESTNGSVTHLSLKRSPMAISLGEGLKYDPLFNRHINTVKAALEAFKPDVLHITGVNDVSIIATIISHQWKLPLVGSWHTNLHEFASRRLARMFRFLPIGMRSDLTGFAEKWILKGSIYYYKIPKVVLSPNMELVDLLAKGTGRDSLLMTRGVDSDFFSPAKRTVNDGIIRLGFVGRLRAEKNLRLLADLEKRLIDLGKTNFKFVIIGEGNEREYLEKTMKRAEFTGFIDGEDLAHAYANLDIFVFPSETDAFGNVIQEAHSSGVPAIVSQLGGPKFIIKEYETGFVAKNLDDFVEYTVELIDDPEKLTLMKKRSREYMLSRSWDAVFESVYQAYDIANLKRSPKMREW